jgi:hypothetical protein
MANMVGDSGPGASLEGVLAWAPQSLVQYSRSLDFQEIVQELADRQGESLDIMRQKVLLGMVSTPQRSDGEPTEDDWRRILYVYSLILKPNDRGLGLHADIVHREESP